MLDWQKLLSQQLQQVASTLVHFVRARRRAETAIGIAAILFWIGYSFIRWLPPGLQEWVQSWQGNIIVSGVLYIVGLIFLFYGSYFIWQAMYIPDLLPVTNRPSAIKGPDAFAPADGELFRKLGREEDLRKLLGYIEDDQVRLIVLMGESGVGKTSLVRAGLTDILKDKGIGLHYWEAVSTSQEKSLLRAIQESWRSTFESNVNIPYQPSANFELRSLEQLINPSNRHGVGKHVVVLDQFEQLRWATNGPVFKLLRKVARDARPPHLVTWVVVFRREFRADWSDFMISEQEKGFYRPEISLQLFAEEQAREVIGQLSLAAGLTIEQKVVDSLIGAAKVNGKVSPVDIGIGLQVLSGLSEQRGGNVVSSNVYHFAGGAEGLLMQYIDTCLDSFLDKDRKSILAVLLALRDPETDQRIAEGRTCVELEKETKADTGQLYKDLERLTQRNLRLLEHVAVPDSNETHYRLAHERFIPALNRLSGEKSGKKEEAKLRLERAFSAWKNSEGKSQYLLRTRDLRLVERYRKQTRWGQEKQEKLKFLKRSQRRRTLIRSTLAAGMICLSAGAWFANWQYELHEATKNLRDNHYPPELYDWQSQLKRLEISEPYNGMYLPWLRSDTSEELTIKATNSTSSLARLGESLLRCPALTDLILDLSDSQVRDLAPLSKLTNLTYLDIIIEQADSLEPLSKLINLTHLKLKLKYNKPSILKPLSKLTNLTYLYLDVPWVDDLKLLSELTNLTRLVLDLSDSKLTSLEPLSRLTNLTYLYLLSGDVGDLRALYNLSSLAELRLLTTVHDLEPLSGLTNLTELSVKRPKSGLQPLSNLPNLTGLRIALDDLKASDVEVLSDLAKLTRLELDLRGNQLTGLEALSQLTSLTQLKISNADEVSDLKPLLSLPRFAQLELTIDQMSGLNSLSKLINLTRLILKVRRLDDLTPLSHLVNLTELELDIQSGHVSDLQPLSKLVNLNKLGLSMESGEVRDLSPLSNLTNLDQLSLGYIKASDLEALSSLVNLTELNLDLSVTSVGDLTPLSNLVNLTNLDLDLGSSEVRDLKPLSNLTSLTKLDLKIGNNPVSDLGPLSKLMNLTQLNLDLTYSELSDLSPLIELNSCQSLVLVLSTDQRMALRALPKKVTYLKF